MFVSQTVLIRPQICSPIWLLSLLTYNLKMNITIMETFLKFKRDFVLICVFMRKDECKSLSKLFISKLLLSRCFNFLSFRSTYFKVIFYEVNFFISRKKNIHEGKLKVNIFFRNFLSVHWRKRFSDNLSKIKFELILNIGQSCLKTFLEH